MTPRLPSLIALSLVLATTVTRAQSVPDTLIGFLRGAAAEAAQHAGGPRVALRVLPETAPAAVTQVFAEQLQLRNIQVAGVPAGGGPGTDPLLTVEVRELRTAPVSRADSAYLTRLRASLGAYIRQPETGAVPWSRSYALDVTQPASPQDAARERDWLADAETSWLERWGGPLIITAAAIVIAVLLFTVRGS